MNRGDIASVERLELNGAQLHVCGVVVSDIAYTVRAKKNLRLLCNRINKAFHAGERKRAKESHDPVAFIGR